MLSCIPEGASGAVFRLMLHILSEALLTVGKQLTITPSDGIITANELPGRIDS